MGEIKLFGQKIILQPKEEPKSPNKNNIDQENNNEETINKKPDKIIPCPRCKSMETKFCYFNNYNVNQPRHFCKGCQRYWTAGGALRNVPIGAGRRKAKNILSCSNTFSSENCLFEEMDSSLRQFEYNGLVVDEWQLAAAMAAHGGFGVKRRKSEPSD